MRRLRVATLPLALILASAAMAAAQTSISGQVTLVPAGNPPDISMEAVDPFSEWVVGSTALNPDGTYEITGLPAGQYKVRSNSGGTAYVREYWASAATNVYDTGGATLVSPPAANVDLTLETGARITGHVYLDLTNPGVEDPGDPPLVGVNVHAEILGQCCFGVGTPTDASGNYELRGLFPATYQVTVEHGDGPGGEPFVAERWNDRSIFGAGDPVTIVGTTDATGRDFGMAVGQEISGQVFNDTNDNQIFDGADTPVTQATVRLFRSGFCCDHANPDGAGNYRIAAAPGSYTISATPNQGTLVPEFWDNVFFQEQATPVTVTTVAGAPGLNFGLVDGAPYGTLQGRVLQPGGVVGIPGVNVRVQSYANGFDRTGTTTDAAGNFSIGNLPAGEYKVLFDTFNSNVAGNQDFVAEYWNRCQDASCPPGVIDPNDFKVVYPTSPGAGADLGTFELSLGASISGTVCVGGEGAACAAGPVPGSLSVRAQPFVNSGPFQPFLPNFPVNSTNGSYRMRGLPAPAAYKVQAQTWGTDFVPVYFVTSADSTFDNNQAASVQANPGGNATLTDLHVFLGGSISGHVTCASGATDVPNVGINVHLVSQPGVNFWSGSATDGDGLYAVRGLPAGEYEVMTGLPGENTPCGNLANEEFPTLVTVVQGADTPSVDFDLEAGGSIQGTVTQIVGGSPIPVVNLRISANDYDTGEFPSDDFTDENGAYSIGSLSLGRRYRVTAETRDNPDDAQFFNFIREYYDNKAFQNQANPVDVPDPTPVLGIDFVLELGGAISGTVTDEATGQPLSGVRVSANEMSAPGCCGNGDNTDPNGFYIIRGLRVANYQVNASPAPLNYIPECWDDTPNCGASTPVAVAAVPPGGPVPVTGNIDFALAAGRIVRGRVTRAAGGAAVPNLYVAAWQPSPPFGFGAGSTDSGGSYEIVGLVPGSYRLQPDTIGTDLAFERRTLDVSGGDQPCLDTAGRTDCEDFILAAGSTIRIHAFEDISPTNGVQDPGEGRSGVGIQIRDFVTGAGPGTDDQAFFGSTDANGLFVVTGLAAGSYRINTDQEAGSFVTLFYDNKLRNQDANPLLLGPGATVDADFRLLAGGSVQGHVFFDSTNGDGVQDGGEPDLAGLRVNVNSLDGAFNYGTQTDGNGDFTVPGVLVSFGGVPVMYRTMVDARNTPYASEYHRRVGGLAVGTFRPSLADTFNLGGGNALGKDFSLVLGGSVSGTITEDGTGSPLGAIQVDVDPFDNDGIGQCCASTDSSGHYLVDGLPPGTYRVFARDNSGVFLAEYWNNQVFSQAANPVTVVARSAPADPLSTTADFALSRGGAVEGVVYEDMNGNNSYDLGVDTPIVGARVTVSELASPNRCCLGSGSNTTGADGRFSRGGLPPGIALRVFVNGPTGSSYIGVFYDGAPNGDRGTTSGSSAASVSVPAGGTTPNINFALALGGAIDGIAYQDMNANDSYDLGTDTPLANVGLTVSQFAAPNNCCFGSNTNTGADGRFHITGVPAGTYRVQTNSPSGFDFVNVFYDGAPNGDRGSTSSANAAAITISAGGTTADVNFALTLGGSISGVVRDGNGNALANLNVNANPITPGLSGSGRNTDSSGVYILRGLAAGQYRVNAGGGSTGFPQELWNNQPDNASATPVVVTVGATTTGINFFLAPRPTLTSGPTPSFAVRGGPTFTLQVGAGSLAGPSCDVSAPPCSKVLLGGAGLTLGTQTLTGSVFSFDVTLAADAPVGARSVSIVNDFPMEDTVLVVTGAFDVTQGGTPPAPGGEWLYLSNSDTSQIHVFGTADNAETAAPIDACCDPAGLAASADGHHLYVAGADRSIAVIDNRLGQEVLRIPALGPFGANALAVKGRALYSINREFLSNNRVQVTDTKTWQPASPAEIVVGPLGVNPFGLRLDPLGRWLYVANQTGVSPATATVVVIDAVDPLHPVLATISFPQNFSPRGIAFTPDGSRAYVTGQPNATYVIDTAQALLPQPNQAFVDVDGDAGTGFAIPAPSTQTGISPIGQGSNQGHIEIAPLPASSSAFAYIAAGTNLRIVDVSTNPDRPVIVRTLTPGIFNAGALRATADGGQVYVTYLHSKDLHVVDMRGVGYDTGTRQFLTPTLPLARFARDLGPSQALLPTGLALGPIPGAVPGSAPTVAGLSVDGGAPARNGGPSITVTLTGSGFSTDLVNPPIVWLKGTLVRGVVNPPLSSASLSVTFPSSTPTGDHVVVVTNPLDTGNETGPSSAILPVRAPLTFAPQQNVYVSDIGKDSVTIYQPDGERDALISRASIATEPNPAGLALSPDGSGAVVTQLYSGVYPSINSFVTAPEGELACVDLDPASPQFRQAVQVPNVYGVFESPAMTRDAADPDGVFAYVPNRNLSDTISLINPAACSEVDADDNPATQTYADPDDWGELAGFLPGVNRIELDANVADLNVGPNDVALTPDGGLLYVAQAGRLAPGTPAFPPSLGIVDTSTREVVGRLTYDGDPSDAGGSGLRGVTQVAVSADGTSVYALGFDSQVDASGIASPFLFVYHGGVLADTPAAFDTRIALTAADGDVATRKELARGITLSADGSTLYTVTRLRGELLAIKVIAPNRGQVNRFSIAGGKGFSAHALAVEDNLLYVTNVFTAQVFVFSLSDPMNPAFVTTFGAKPCPGDVAVQPTTLRPRVTGVSPSTGPVEGGIPVTITGSHFVDGATVHFDGAPALPATFVSSLRIDAVLPPGANGLADVKVTNPDAQSSTLVGRFRYQADPNAPVFTSAPYKVDGSEVFSGPPGLETVALKIRWTTDEVATSRVDYGTTSALGAFVSSPALVTLHEVTLSGLVPATQYHFRATSVDAAVPSNSASNPVAPSTLTFTTPSAPDVTAPLITSGPTVSVTPDSALVQWATNEDADSVVKFDTTIDGDPTIPEVGSGGDVRNHSVTVTGLPPFTLHEYLVLSRDAAGNPVQSDVRTFRTAPAPDEAPPLLLSGPSLSYLASDLVIVTWTTNEPSTSFVNYGAFGGSTCNINEQGVIDVSLVTTHIVFLTNLLPGTRYAFQAGSTDPSGNTFLTADPCPSSLGFSTLGTSQLRTDRRAGVMTLEAGTMLTVSAAAIDFETPAAPDTVPPVVTSPVTVSLLSFDRVLIMAATDEAASLRVRFGISGLTESAFEPTFTQGQSLFLGGLSPNTTYQLEAVFSDPKGNATTVGGLSFTTPAAPDTTAPVISALAASSVTSFGAVITWTTDEPASSLVHFGVQGQPVVDQAGLLGLRTSHSITLTELQPGTTYAFQAESRDANDNLAAQPGAPFTTAFVPPDVETLTPAQATPGTVLDLILTGTRFDADAVVSVDSGITVNQYAVNPAGTHISMKVTVSALASVGIHELEVTNPQSGLSDSTSFTVMDDTVPVLTITSPASGATLPSRTVVVQGTVSEMAAVTVNDTLASLTGTGPFSFTATVVLQNGGSNSITVTATDASGNQATQVVDVVVDTLQVSGGSIVEGDHGTVLLPFTVTLNAPRTDALSVEYTTGDGTAVAGADYEPTTGTLVFSPGESTQTVSIPVLSDRLSEDDETVRLTLTSPDGGGQGQGTIRDDDPLVHIQMDNATVAEGNSGTTNAVLMVTLSGASGRTVSVAYETIAGTATPGPDYQPVSGVLTFAPGVTSRGIAVPVIGDLLQEHNEEFEVVLSNAVGATLQGSTNGKGKIKDDDK